MQLLTHLSRSLGAPTVGKGAGASTLVHAVGLAAVWGYGLWVTTGPQRAELHGARRSVQLEASIAVPPADAAAAPQARVVVMPRAARIARRHFVATPARPALRGLSDEPLIATLPPPDVSRPRRIEWGRTDPPRVESDPPPARPRRAASTAALPRPAGTDDLQPPTFEGNRPPIYPATAIARRLEGEVLLEVHIGATGAVERVEVARTSGHPVLDAAAVTSVRDWRFGPARLHGRPVATVEFLPVQFRLPR